jgi:PAS domain S-box-containing protein
MQEKPKVLVAAAAPAAGPALSALEGGACRPLGPVAPEDLEQALADHRPALVVLELEPAREAVAWAHRLNHKWELPAVYLLRPDQAGLLAELPLVHPHGYALKPAEPGALRVAVETALFVDRLEARRQEAERRLVERDTFYRDIANHLPGLVFSLRVRPDGTFSAPFVSSRVRELRQVSPEEIAQDPPLLFQGVPEEDLPRITKALAASVAELAPYRVEHRHRLADGGLAWFRVEATPHRLPGGEVELTGIALDISPQRRAQEELARSEARFRTVFEHAPVGVFISTPQGRFLEVNQALADMLGYATPAEVVSSVQDIGREIYVDPDRRREIVEELRRRQGITNWTNLYRRRDGSRFVGSMSLRQVDLGREGGPFFLGLVEDVTRRQEDRRRLEAALAEKEVLLREVHHRVKNNMQVVASLLSLQAQSVGSAKARRLCRESLGRIRAMSLIHESLYQADDVARVDLASYLERLTSRLQEIYACPEVGLELSVRPPGLALDPGLAFPAGLAVNELVVNALSHAFPAGRGGRVQVAARVREHGLVLEVADDGVGLPREAARASQGGLGLDLVRGLVESQLGGRLELAGGEGTTATLVIPLPAPA